MGIKGWTAAHNAHVVEKAPRKSQITMVLGAAIWGALAVLLTAVAIDGGGVAGLRGFALPIVMSLGISAWFVWRATRFRIIRETSLDGDGLELAGARGSVTLRPRDVTQVVQRSRNPFGSGIYNTANAAWGAWFRIDASVDGGKVRRYVAWRPDTSSFLRQLRQAGFPLVGEVVAVPEAS